MLCPMHCGASTEDFKVADQQDPGFRVRWLIAEGSNILNISRFATYESGSIVKSSIHGTSNQQLVSSSLNVIFILQEIIRK